MKRFLRLPLFILIVLPSWLHAQNNFWSDADESAAHSRGLTRTIVPVKYRTLALDTISLKSALRAAPLEFSSASVFNPLVLALPMPDGSLAHFKVVEYSMMEPALQAKFPDIRTYSGQGIEDPTATLKLDWTSFGLHAMILSPRNGSVWIDPYARGEKSYYISYRKTDLQPRSFTEIGVLGAENAIPGQSRLAGGPCLAGQLRSYRLAVACTGEYAVAVGGTTAPLLHSAIVTSVNRVNGVYEMEVAIRLVLIGNNNLIEYLDATTDLFTGNNNATTLINESQSVINSVIGSANYDIGHTFSTGGGGLAQVGCVCTAGSKARGITGSPDPVGDAYDIDYVAHEMGHQFGGLHTFNAATGNCSGNGSPTANAEPGSGTTIMAYAGICTTNDLQPHSDPQFHPISFDQIGTFSRSGTGATCGTVINTGNQAPTVNAGSNYTIPISTPFTLTGSATDPDGDALTYSWEQVDVGGAFGNWNAPTGLAPLFRSFPPVTSPSRTFPRMFDLANNTTTIGEILPSYVRNMKFRLTARDNRSGGGGVCYSEITVSTSGATAFTVTSQAAATSWTANGSNTATITWTVAGTTAAPFNTSNVDILFSSDGGFTFPYTLLSNTPNDGTQTITIPSIPTTKGRVMVRARGNIFFDINTGLITITSACSAEGAVVAPANSVTAAAGNAALNLGLSPQFSTAFTPTGTLESTDPASSLAVYSSVSLSCVSASNVMKYDAYVFMPSITATYTFTLTGVFPTVMNLYSTSFDPLNPCTNFLKSNSTFNGTTVSIGATATQALTAGSIYVLVIGTFSDVQPPLPAPYSVAVSSATPAGGVIYSGSTMYNNPGAGFSYAYVVVNNATGNIAGISATSNLTNSSTYPAGSYTVYGLSYSNSIANLNSFVGGSFSNLATSVFSNPSGFCANFSKNSVSVTILAGPVPVRGLELTARKNGRKSQLTWTTEQEINTRYFNILRSEDGVQFSALPGRVNAAGNTQSARQYVYSDDLPLNDRNFYRIEAVDADGAKAYSNTAVLSYSSEGTPVFLYPNPANDLIRLNFTSAAGNMQVTILDSKGSRLLSRNQMVQEGRNLPAFDISSLPSGMYIFRYILPGGETGHIKFVRK